MTISLRLFSLARTLRPLVATAILVVGGGLAAQPATHRDQTQQIDPLVTTFKRLSDKKQEEVLARVTKDLEQMPDPFLKIIRLLAWQAGVPTTPRIEKFPKRSKAHTSIGDFTKRVPFPINQEYVFGIGIIVPVGKLYQTKNGKSKRHKKKRKKPAKLTCPVRAEQLAAYLAGYPPALDKALAVLLQKLDKDAGADRFFAFLESWRNGTESFYQALDRTAGTPDSIFFYDAMLGEFVARFLPQDKPQYSYIKRSLITAHDALHDAFLAYRQYRGFREAIAFSLLLPPGAKLPPTLARYEAKTPKGYSLRQQIVMLLAHHDHNPIQVVNLITAGAEDLPVPLWSNKYNPFINFSKSFRRLLPELAKTVSHTDVLLKKAENQRTELARKIAARTREILLASGLD